MKRRTFLGAATASLAATQLARPASASGSPARNYEVVARFWGAMPTGVTVSRRGRIFVNFPRWGDDVPFTVAELRGGKPIAYPNAAVNRQDAADLAGHLQPVQSVVVDPADRLWIAHVTPLQGLTFLDLDVASDTSATATVKQVIDRFGRIDVLVNNAGVGSIGAVEEVSIAQAQTVFDINVFGVMRMRPRAPGRPAWPHSVTPRPWPLPT